MDELGGTPAGWEPGRVPPQRPQPFTAEVFSTVYCSRMQNSDGSDGLTSYET